MQENNPYAAPSSNLGGQDSYGEQTGGVTQGVVRELSGTKGWAKFVGVLMCIFAVLIAIVAIVAQRYMEQMLRTLNLPFSASQAVMFVTIIALIAAVVIAVYGVLLVGFSSRIAKLEDTGSEADLASALDRQRVYWTFAAIVSIIMLLFSLYGMIR
jgi:hypothetical protein